MAKKPITNNQQSSDFLLEIGTEEIPSADFNQAMEQLYTSFIELKELKHFSFADENISVLGTPRRLSVLIKNFPRKQDDVVSKKVKGPPAEFAFKDNKPTKAALGFAKAQGVKVDDLRVESTSKGDYLFAITTKPGEPSEVVLKRELPELILSLEFKKAMRWEDDIRFIRPIRWIVAMMGSKVIKFKLGSLTSSNITYGHRLLYPKAIKINKVSEYKETLRKAKVEVDQEVRARTIERSMKNLKNGRVDMTDPRIQETFCEVVNLVEKPSTLVGNFDKKFLKLPQKVVETVLQSHQRYFPIQTKSGTKKLTNSFLVVHNGNPQKKELIKGGHEKVIQARLEDGEFYFKEDTRQKLSSRVFALDGIVFHKHLGTLLDKTKRLQFLVKKIAEKLDFSEQDTKVVTIAAKLAKADLLTSMVGEFDELQGFIGAEYALREGVSKKVANSIAEQYLPRHGKDVLPKTKSGAILSIADRIDTLCAYISIGLTPTSTGDPYALRRQATGMIDIILSFGFDISIPWLATITYKRLAKDFKRLAKETEVVLKTTQLAKARLEFRLSQTGIDYDIIRSVAKTDTGRPVDFKERTLALQFIRNKENKVLQDIITVCNRASSIADKNFGTKINTDFLIEKEEKAFYKLLLKTEKQLDEEILKGKYKEAIRTLSSLKKTIDVFFDEVLVMVKKKELRKNRHALLNRFVLACLRVADLSEIVKD